MESHGQGSTRTSSDDAPIAPLAGPSRSSYAASGPSDSAIAPGRSSTSSERDSFSLRPTFMQKFRPPVATKFMQNILQNHLQHRVYQAEECQKLSKLIAEDIKTKLIELELGRYKYIVNVVLGENLGEGARMDARCYWDQESDGQAQAFFTNDSLWCAAVGFAVFYY